MSGTTSRLAGLAVMQIDGEPWDVVSDLEYLAVQVVRETLKGQTAVEGYSEMPTQCYISATLRDRPDYALSQLNTKTNSEVIALLASGKSVYGTGMWNTELGAVRTQEGTFTVRFDGPLVTEQLVGA